MRRARTLALMLAVTVGLVAAANWGQVRDRMHGPDGERGASALEWAIIAAIVVALAGVVGGKIIAAVNAHAAQIK
jgi:hypothetical protein